MNKLTAVVEMPMGSLYKYEAKDGSLFVDRINEHRVPYNYGYIVGTYAPDGDPLDVFIMSEDDLQPLATVEIDVLGIYQCSDNGFIDDKVVAVIKGDPRSYSREMIDIYLDTYKKGFKRLGFRDRESALSTIAASEVPVL